MGMRQPMQPLNLQSDECMGEKADGLVGEGIIIHEFMHALGFIHEHQRPDRDPYVTIYEENLLNSNASSQFDPIPADTFGEEYDYFPSCIMHQMPLPRKALKQWYLNSMSLQ